MDSNYYKDQLDLIPDYIVYTIAFKNQEIKRFEDEILSKVNECSNVVESYFGMKPQIDVACIRRNPLPFEAVKNLIGSVSKQDIINSLKKFQ